MNKEELKLLVGIPVYISNKLHLDFTRKTINSLESQYEMEVLIINNYCDAEFRDELDELGEVYDAEENNLSAAWNTIINYGIDNGYDYFFIINNDLIFRSDSIDNLVAFAEEHPEFLMWTSNEHSNLRTLNSVEPENDYDFHPHFSAFMVSERLVKELETQEEGTKEPFPGLFDENFKPAYMEDNDMHNRILRVGSKAAKTASSLFYHYGSRTIKVDEKLNRRNKATHRRCREYFIKKWGFNPDGRSIPNDDPMRFKYSEPFVPKGGEKNGKGKE